MQPLKFVFIFVVCMFVMQHMYIPINTTRSSLSSDNINPSDGDVPSSPASPSTKTLPLLSVL